MLNVQWAINLQGRLWIQSNCLQCNKSSFTIKQRYVYWKLWIIVQWSHFGFITSSFSFGENLLQKERNIHTKTHFSSSSFSVFRKRTKTTTTTAVTLTKRFQIEEIYVFENSCTQNRWYLCGGILTMVIYIFIGKTWSKAWYETLESNGAGHENQNAEKSIPIYLVKHFQEKHSGTNCRCTYSVYSNVYTHI